MCPSPSDVQEQDEFLVTLIFSNCYMQENSILSIGVALEQFSAEKGLQVELANLKVYLEQPKHQREGSKYTFLHHAIPVL